MSYLHLGQAVRQNNWKHIKILFNLKLDLSIKKTIKLTSQGKVPHHSFCFCYFKLEIVFVLFCFAFAFVFRSVLKKFKMKLQVKFEHWIFCHSSSCSTVFPNIKRSGWSRCGRESGDNEIPKNRHQNTLCKNVNIPATLCKLLKLYSCLKGQHPFQLAKK